jgi:hypothetical protein
MKIMLLLAALVIFLSGTEAQNLPRKPQEVVFWSPLSGEDLVRKCKLVDSESDSPTKQDGLQCLVYISGFTDGYGAALIPFHHNKQAAFCPPDGVNLGQMAKIVVKFGTDHPEDLWMKAPSFTLQALSNAYPCQA